MHTDSSILLPPLQGCLYCHAEGTTSLSNNRKIFGFGGDFPTLKCTNCGSVALLDANPAVPEHWRIRYRRVDHNPKYYYVALHFGQAGWLSGQDALDISTNGYVQRKRVEQTKVGDLSWLRPLSFDPPPPFIAPDETVYLSLRAVTYREAPSSLFLLSGEQGAILDSGKLYVTDRKLHLLGQRRDWSHALDMVLKTSYDDKSWVLHLDSPDQPQRYHGINASDQLDAQLVTAVVETLRVELSAARRSRRIPPHFPRT